MRRSLLWLSLLALLAATAVTIQCGKEDSGEDENCPSFADYQIYPDIGGPESVFELYVRLEDDEPGFEVERMYAELYLSGGLSGGVTFDMVRSETDHLRYLRTFRGNEVCEDGTCSLYFKIYAVHVDGCVKTFETDMFQVVIDQGDDDTAD